MNKLLTELFVIENGVIPSTLEDGTVCFDILNKRIIEIKNPSYDIILSNLTKEEIFNILDLSEPTSSDESKMIIIKNGKLTYGTLFDLPDFPKPTGQTSFLYINSLGSLSAKPLNIPKYLNDLEDVDFESNITNQNKYLVVSPENKVTLETLNIVESIDYENNKLIVSYPNKTEEINISPNYAITGNSKNGFKFICMISKDEVLIEGEIVYFKSILLRDNSEFLVEVSNQPTTFGTFSLPIGVYRNYEDVNSIFENILSSKSFKTSYNAQTVVALQNNFIPLVVDTSLDFSMVRLNKLKSEFNRNYVIGDFVVNSGVINIISLENLDWTNISDIQYYLPCVIL